MSSVNCMEWCKTFVRDTALSQAFATTGTNANKFLQTFADFLCNAKTNVESLKQALNLQLQDDFTDSDKARIFENIISQKEQEFDLYKSNVFDIPSDLLGRLELLRIVDALVRGKIQSIGDIKKVISFLGVNDVEFHLKFPDGVIEKGLILPLWGQTSYEYSNTWKVFLPTTLLLDIEKKQVIENFILLLKEPQYHYKFYYIL